MPPNSEKKKFAQELYEKSALDLDQIATKLNITTKQLEKWIKSGKWRRIKLTEAAVEQAEKIANQLEGVDYDQNKPLLAMLTPVLELAIENLHAKLLAEKENEEYGAVRDYAGLIGRLMDIKGKITGETSGGEKDLNEARHKTLGEFSAVLAMFRGQDGREMPKKLTGKSEVIDIEAYKVNTIA